MRRKFRISIYGNPLVLIWIFEYKLKSATLNNSSVNCINSLSVAGNSEKCHLLYECKFKKKKSFCSKLLEKHFVIKNVEKTAINVYNFTMMDTENRQKSK